MDRVLSRELKDKVGETVTVQGWLHKKRLMGGLNFINIRDRSGLVQALVEDKDEIEKLRGMQIGSVVTFTGEVVADDRAPGGAELHGVKVQVDVPITEEPPIEIDKPLSHKSENLDTLFDNRVLGLRNLREADLFRVQAGIKEHARNFLNQNEFTEFDSPKLLPGATEGGAEVFSLDYFGQEATLAQSAQFYKQIMVGVYERVFEIGTTYRAEPSATTRHMTEFLTIDVEMGFVDFEGLLSFTGSLLKYINEKIWETHKKELTSLNATPAKLTDKIPQITLAEVHELYTKAKGESTIGEKDLRPDEERFICEYSKKKFGSEAVFVTEWPASEMKFYHHKTDGNPELADRADLIFRGIEIATVPMREHRYDVLVDQLKNIAGGDPEAEGFKYYLQAFKYGLPPHGGFGMGLERLTARIVGLNNVKEASLFPRDINRLAP